MDPATMMILAQMMGGGMGGGGSPVQGGLGGVLGGLFGGSDKPYGDAMKQFQKYATKSEKIQNPFLQAGHSAVTDMQRWLQGMLNPTAFINKTMGDYQESPYAKYLQDQTTKAGINAASAGGLVGSTPFAQQMQQNAAGIASQDMQNWLQNVLGINTQYGQGQQYLSGMGQNAANALTGLYGNMGQLMGEGAYGQRAGRNQDFANLLGGGLKLGGHIFNF